ncbi:dihydrofolate reductase [bacterium]|nr:dihydrofolate reductase [bacterium]
MKISLIVAVAKNGVIGKNNSLVWRLPADLKHFKNLTTNHSILMGRKTFEAIGKPLLNRKNVVITRQKDFFCENCFVANSLENALELCKNDGEIFIIGGAEIYKQSLDLVEKIYLTKIYEDFEGDTFFPELNENSWLETSRQDFLPDDKNLFFYSFITLEKKRENAQD